MNSSSSTKLRKLSLFQFQRQKNAFYETEEIFSPYIVNVTCFCIVINYHWIAVNQTLTIWCKFALGELDNWSRNLYCHQKENQLGKRKRKDERGEWRGNFGPAVHWVLFEAEHGTFFVMNNTDKSCFFFEYNVAIFDQLEDVFITNIITCILNCLFSLITCLGNFLILFAIGKNRDLHSPSFILLGCLAASDLLVGLICQPLFVAADIAELRKNYNAHCTLRMLLHFTGWMTVGVSLLILTTVLIDRLLALTLHLRYNTIVTVPRVFLIILGFWIFAITLNVARFWMSKKWYFIAIAFFVLPFLVITLSTLKIFQISRKHQSQINDQHVAVSHLQSNTVNVLKCKKSAVTVLYIYGLFVVAYLPWLSLTTAAFFIGYPRELKIASNFARTAVFINSFLNPVVYCWRNREIRRAVKNILRRGRH